MKKEIIISSIIGLLVGGVIFGGIGVVFGITYNASNITYTPSDTSWNVSTVQSAIDDLNEKMDSTAFGSLNISNTDQVTINTGFRAEKIIILIPSSAAGFWIELMYDPSLYGDNIYECNLRSGRGSCGSGTLSSYKFSITDNGFTYGAPVSNYYGQTYWYAIK